MISGNANVGNAIKYLRGKIGYTQRELADRIGVSDKAVSKWERGIGLPDASIIGKLAILLDSDADSILSGDLVHHNADWVGLLVLKENEQGIHVNSIIYDKPIMNYLLSYFVLMGIKNIGVVCGNEDMKYIDEEFGDGGKLGVKISFIQDIHKQYAYSQTNVMVVFGMTFLYGVDQSRFFQRAMIDKNKTTILSLPKKKNELSSRIYFDSDKKIVTSEAGDKLRTQYDYHQLPIVFCPSSVIADMDIENAQKADNIPYTKLNGEVYTVVLDRGFVEIPLNTWDDIWDASSFVSIVQKACGMQLYCIEEIAWRRGMISRNELAMFGEKMKNTPYGEYICEIADVK